MAETCSAEGLFDALLRAGMTHIVGVPDNGSAALFTVAARHPEVESLTATREGEAIAIASGLWLGGKKPVVVIQNTGLLEAGDGLRGTAYRMGAPLLLLVGVRGHVKLMAHHVDIERARASGHMAQIMKRADIDSVAVITEPTLEAWQIPYTSYRSAADIAEIEALWSLARDAGHPVSALLPFPLE